MPWREINYPIIRIGLLILFSSSLLDVYLIGNYLDVYVFAQPYECRQWCRELKMSTEMHLWIRIQFSSVSPTHDVCLCWLFLYLPDYYTKDWINHYAHYAGVLKLHNYLDGAMFMTVSTPNPVLAFLGYHLAFRWCMLTTGLPDGGFPLLVSAFLSLYLRSSFAFRHQWQCFFCACIILIW